VSKITEALKKAAKEREEKLKGKEAKAEKEVGKGQDAAVASGGAAVAVPKVEKIAKPKKVQKAVVEAEVTPAKLIAPAQVDERVVLLHDPDGNAAEQYRALRTNIVAMNEGVLPQSIIMTSADDTPARAFAAINFGLCLAEDEDLRVAVVECNFRNPIFATILGGDVGQGLLGVLWDEKKMEEVLLGIEGVGNLFILPSGGVLESPGELVTSDELHELLGGIVASFDVTLIEVPSAVYYSDASVLGTVVDGVVIVAEAGKTRREVILRAASTLEGAKVRLFGVLLSEVVYVIPDFIYKRL